MPLLLRRWRCRHCSFSSDAYACLLTRCLPPGIVWQAVRREARALHRVRHPNVVKLHGLCFEPAPMVLMAFAEGGTLQDALDRNRFQTNSEVP